MNGNCRTFAPRKQRGNKLIFIILDFVVRINKRGRKLSFIFCVRGG